ncbi:MAG: elongation factor G [Deltaproteobacteria bacterium]|jgi:elongation factor G|nr:elongation factor G [Deltaproteobacteria bacterium]
MKEYQSGDIRNFAMVGHGSSGKTMLCEAMLARSGAINRLGSIAGGTTVSDYHDDEHERQISIHASLLHTEWEGKKFNIIDTPGYLDFTSESLGALRVADFALVVLHANHGVEVGTEQVWEYATNYGIPKVIVINGLDKENTDFDKLLEETRKRFGKRVFPMTLPVNPGPGFNQLIDVIQNGFVTYSTDGTGKNESSPATGEWEERVKALHGELIEFVAESDDSLLEKFFDQGALTEDELRGGLHTAIQSQSFIPLFTTSAESNVGVARLMDFIARYGSSPVDRETVTAINAGGDEFELPLHSEEPVVYIFKTLGEAHLGELSFFRVYSGTLRSGTEIYNSDRKITEKIGQIFILNGKNRMTAKALHGGDIGAAVKLKDTHTGNTLCSSKQVVTLPKVEFPKPNIHAALKTKSKGDEDKIAAGLATIHEEDPTFLYRTDPELHQLVISGQGDLHLQTVCEALKRRFNVEVELVEPRIPFRETIKSKGSAKYRHKKQSGGAGQFAEVWMSIEPRERGAGIEFTESLRGQNVDRVFVPSVEKGVNVASEEGVLAGYRVVDVKIDFYDGKQHPVDSKDIAFQIAGKQAFREAVMSAKPCLLEPICTIEVKVPEECMGDVMGDISSRRGKILGMDSSNGFQIIRAQVPQAELYRYSTTLRSMTGGRGIYAEEFSHYEEMAREQEQRIVAESKREG